MIFQVDDGVIREIYPALLQSDWSLLIAHFLGVVLLSEPDIP